MIKGLEALEIIKKQMSVDDFPLLEHCRIIEKELKALEIIKGFRKDKYSTMEIYGNDIVMNVYLTLDDNEIDLLKEVLL